MKIIRDENKVNYDFGFWNISQLELEKASFLSSSERLRILEKLQDSTVLYVLHKDFYFFSKDL